MYKFGDEKGQLKCSFCGKLQDQVKKLVPVPVCTSVMNASNYCEIIEEELGEEIDFELKIFKAQRDQRGS